jgi:hypothetical protein
MDGLVGLLKVRVIRGINLAYRDARGSDPYVVLRLGRKVVLLFSIYVVLCSIIVASFGSCSVCSSETEDKCEEEICQSYLARRANSVGHESQRAN